MNNSEQATAVQGVVAESREWLQGLDIAEQSFQDLITRSETIGHAVFNEKYYTISYLKDLVERIKDDREEELKSISQWAHLVEPIKDDMKQDEFSVLDIAGRALERVITRK